MAGPHDQPSRSVTTEEHKLKCISVGSFARTTGIWIFRQDYWDPMQETYDRALKDMVHARQRVADHARVTLGLPGVKLFAQS